MIPLWLLGMGAGALLDKKKPLRGAMLGGAGGFLGPQLLGGSSLFGGGGPGLLGNAAATNPALIESAVGSTGYGMSSASPESFLATASKYMKPAGEALGAASAAQSLFGQPQQQMAPPVQMMPTGDPIGQLMAGDQQQEAMRQKMLEELRRRIYGAP